MENSIKILVDKVNQFRDERNWRQFHKEKDLAISISLEANELLELFQWHSSEEVIQNNQNELKEELADVLIYCFMLADNLNFDVEKIIEEKLVKNAIKYPIEKAFGTNKKYNEF
ncbi:nucleotide pyrophosphohydrolase [Ignavigranum ruoffiae]|uniref:nucleotide pyrophosphohydrolase n=1 Tax=Ignavigranum ruoffiae TaxID=89093 RepID=UPI0024AC9C21|nr:nucleotide pyrophosphohydrolase [Ignavigranum ruoffiae]